MIQAIIFPLGITSSSVVYLIGLNSEKALRDGVRRGGRRQVAAAIN
jgi:hypothetical protein